MQEEFLCILLSVWGELRVALADQSLEHSGGNPSVLLLQREQHIRHWNFIWATVKLFTSSIPFHIGGSRQLKSKTNYWWIHSSWNIKNSSEQIIIIIHFTTKQLCDISFWKLWCVCTWCKLHINQHREFMRGIKQNHRVSYYRKIIRDILHPRF